MPHAYITGASGFIGGALARRLSAEGWTVTALARSDAAAAKVAANGATPARGDLDDPRGMQGADVVFHAAAHLGEWGTREQFVRGNVDGTRNVVAAAKAAGVERLVHVGTEAALMHGKPLVNVDETVALRPDSKALYSATKAMAEQVVLDGGGVVLRPRLVWGKGDTTILPALAEAVRAKKFAWVGGGNHLTSTTHVDNVVEGLVLAAEKGRNGRAYFVTDGEPVVFKDFVTELLATEGLDPGRRSVPRPLAAAIATAAETAWKVLPLSGAPPLTRLAYWLSAQECTIDISRARQELGYVPIRTIDDGLRELA
jgi:nucleoside-diphosphate-sugar epimerase